MDVAVDVLEVVGVLISSEFLENQVSKEYSLRLMEKIWIHDDQ